MNKKADEQKSKVRGLFAQEEESIQASETSTEPKEKTKKTVRRTAKKPITPTVDAEEEKPRFLKTKQAARGILHCEIGPELYERAALFAYDPQAPVKDMTDLAKKCLIAFLDEEEPLLEKLKAFQKRARRSK